MAINNRALKRTIGSGNMPTTSTTPAPVPGSIEASRASDIQQGSQLASSILGPEGLGRMGDDPQMQAILAQRRKMATGLTGQEMQGARDIATQGISGANQTQMRALRAAQASSGVRGATATGQQGQVLAQGAQQKADFERDLMLRNRAAQMAGLGALENTAGGMRKFDLGQAAAEKQMKATGILGMMGMSSAERIAAQQAESARATAEASKPKERGLLNKILDPIGIFNW